MKQAEDLKKALCELFRAREDPEDAQLGFGADALLNSMDFYSLVQTLRHHAQTVYSYRVDGTQRMKFEYRGPVLLPETTLLWEDQGEMVFDAADFSLSHELWLLPDMRLAVVSCLRVKIGNGAYTTEYRAYKGGDWSDVAVNCPGKMSRLHQSGRRGWLTPVLPHHRSCGSASGGSVIKEMCLCLGLPIRNSSAVLPSTFGFQPILWQIPPFRVICFYADW